MHKAHLNRERERERENRGASLLCVLPPLFDMHQPASIVRGETFLYHFLAIHTETERERRMYDGMCLFMACLVNNKYNNNVFGLNYTYVRVCTKG